MRLRFFNADNPLVRRVTYAEWCLLALTITLEALTLAIRGNPATFIRIELCLLFLTALALLSLYWPLSKPTWVRYGVLLFQIYLVGAASMIGYSRWTWPLYLVLVARACLLLNKAQVWQIVAICFATETGWYVYKFLNDSPVTIWHRSLTSSVIAAVLLTASIGVMMVIVRWLMSSLVSEQQLRIEAERLAKENEQLATQLERTRIAREIHDTVGHSLTSLKIQLELAGRLLDVDEMKARQALSQAETLAARSLIDTRVALQSMRNGEFRFESSVRDLLRDLESAGTIAVKAEIDDKPIDSGVAYQLFRVIQESLTNVLKHAQASEVQVRITHGGESVEVEVEDNGRGFCATGRPDSFGLKGVQERVNALRGTVQFESQPEKGTKVKVTVPLS